MTGESAARRYALVTFLTWLPTGLYLAPMVLLMLDRGLGAATIGAAYSVTVMVLELELPTGGLADVLRASPPRSARGGGRDGRLGGCVAAARGGGEREPVRPGPRSRCDQRTE